MFLIGKSGLFSPSSAIFLPPPPLPGSVTMAPVTSPTKEEVKHEVEDGETIIEESTSASKAPFLKFSVNAILADNGDNPSQDSTPPGVPPPLRPVANRLPPPQMPPQPSSFSSHLQSLLYRHSYLGGLPPPPPPTQPPTSSAASGSPQTSNGPAITLPGTGTAVFPLPGSFPWAAGARGE